MGSAVLGTAVGLVLIFAITALFCSGVTEAVSNILSLRARYLLTGLKAMLDEPEASAAGAADANDKKQKKQLHDAALDSTQTSAAHTSVRNLVTQVTPDATLVGDSPFTLALFDNPMIKSLQTRRVRPGKSGKLRNPQYLSGRTFARALIDTLLPTPVDPASGQPDLNVLSQLYQSAQQLPDGSLRATLLALLSQCAGNLNAFEQSLENWYDEEMARISGWYKRWSQVVLGVVGLVVAILVNIDTVGVGHALFVDAPVRQAVSAAADAGTLCQQQKSAPARRTCAEQELESLHASGLPIGYAHGCDPFSSHPARCWAWTPAATLHWWDFPLKLLGWLVTAFAVSFGAPFWFEALSKLGSLRSAGARPPAPAS